MDKNLKLPDDIRASLARGAVLYKMAEEGVDIDSELSGANRALAEVMEAGLKDEAWKKGRKKFELTRKGELMWENWKAKWWDFLANFDVFAGVDLQEGVFAGSDADWDAEDDNGNLIWEDLRVAVCLRKIQLAEKQGRKTSLNPFTIVFLAQLSEGRLEAADQWQFDIAFDSIFWADIQNIVNSQMWPQELSYEDTPWEKVIDDIITQGMTAAKEHWDDDEQIGRAHV